MEEEIVKSQALIKRENGKIIVYNSNPNNDLKFSRLLIEISALIGETKNQYDKLRSIMKWPLHIIDSFQDQHTMLLYLPFDADENSLTKNNIVAVTETEILSTMTTMAGSASDERQYVLNVPTMAKNLTLSPLHKLLVSLPTGLQSKKYRDDIIYQKNSRMYEKNVSWMSHVLGRMAAYDDPTQIPETLQYELERSQLWNVVLEDWFYKAGRDVPKIIQKTKTSKKIWTKGKQAAARHCAEIAEKQLNRKTIDICKEFMEKYTIKEDENYTPLLLASFTAQKIKEIREIAERKKKLNSKL